MSNEKMREEFEAWVILEAENHEYPYMDRVTAKFPDGSYLTTWVDSAWIGWKASRAAPGGYCFVPNETIKKAYVLASSVCGDCYAGEDTESLLANQLTKEISKSDYWMNIK